MCANYILGRLNEAENILSKMNKSVVIVNMISYNILMEGHGSIGHTDSAVSILKHIENVASMLNPFTYTISARHLTNQKSCMVENNCRDGDDR
jgi:pentatricopeptide repeat protein